MLRGPLGALLRPLHPGPLMVIVAAVLVLALINATLPEAELIRWAPRVLVILVLVQYAAVLLEDTANGSAEPPALELQQLYALNPLPLLLAALLGGLWWATSRLPPVAALPVRAVLIAGLPASLGLLCISARRLDAIHPLALLRTLIGLGPWYPLLVAVLAGYAVLLWWLARLPAPDFLRRGLACFCLFSGATLTGWIFHHRRLQLGFEPIHSPERSAQRRLDERRRELLHFVDQLYAPIRSRNYREAAALLQQRLAGTDTAALGGDALLLLEQSRAWDNDAARVFLADRIISELLRRRERSGALDLAAALVRSGLPLKLSSDEDTLQLAHYACAAGQRGLALMLIGDFDQRFATSPRRNEARRLQETLR